MKKVLLTSALALSAIASVSYAATEVPAIPGVTAPTTGTVTEANAKNNHNNRFGYAVSKQYDKAYSIAGAITYPAKPYPGTDGKPLNDSTREFGHNTRFGAGFNATKSTTPATPAKPDPKAIPGVTRPTTEIVTEANAANNHNNRFGYAVSPQYKDAYSVSGAETYTSAPIEGTDGKPLNDATREFDNNTRFGAGFNK
jgi:hypothetical protein